MIINDPKEFISSLQKTGLKTKYLIVKPNWVSNAPGEYTEPEILDWVLKAFPFSKKIIIESYTPWRGLKCFQDQKPDHEWTDLKDSHKYQTYFQKQDRFFLKSTGIEAVLKKHNAFYLNITEEVWKQRCVPPEEVKNLLSKNDKTLKFIQLFNYTPKKIFEIRNQSLFISLAKIKLETGIPSIGVSLSVKNLFGLIPHPSRYGFHGHNHEKVPYVIKDLYTLYTSIFKHTLWINEGIKTMVTNYCESSQKIIYNQNLLFWDMDGKKADSTTVRHFHIDPSTIPYLCLI